MRIGGICQQRANLNYAISTSPDALTILKANLYLDGSSDTLHVLQMMIGTSANEEGPG